MKLSIDKCPHDIFNVYEHAMLAVKFHPKPQPRLEKGVPCAHHRMAVRAGPNPDLPST
jgi:hypothetical protein